MSDWKPQERAATPGAPPGWGTAFPPEKPRRDLPAQALTAPAPDPAATPAVNAYQGANPYAGAAGFAPAPAAYQPAAATAMPRFGPQPVDARTENRSGVDIRRIIAGAIDLLLTGLVLFPVSVAYVDQAPVNVLGITPGAFCAWLGICFSYFFFAESAFGQTVGKRLMKLRVTRSDGEAASSTQVAGRTIFRLFDGAPIGWILSRLLTPNHTLIGPDWVHPLLYFPWIGIVSFYATGRRRQRLGDLVTQTCVRNADRDYALPSRSILRLAYPLLWIGMGLVAAPIIDAQVRAPIPLAKDPYLRAVDRICRQRLAAQVALRNPIDPYQLQDLSLTETKAVEQLPPFTRRGAAGRKVFLRYQRRIDRGIAKLIRDARSGGDPIAAIEADLPPLRAVAHKATVKFAKMGLPHCAGIREDTG
jgi:uncharacterized RDD family membrane protein YckC